MTGWTVSKSVTLGDILKVLGIAVAALLFVRSMEMSNQRLIFSIEQNARSIEILTSIVDRHENAIQAGREWRLYHDGLEDGRAGEFEQ